MLKQKEWIDVIVEKTGCSRKEAKVMYDCVFDYMREQISPEELIKISGFGVLKLRKTAPKEQINLITGKPEIVPEHNVVTFRPYFEIDPKPEAIDMEDEDVEDAIARAEAIAAADRAAREQAAKEAAEKEAAEKAAREAAEKEAAEKAAAEEAARKAEEEAKKAEEAKEEPKEEEPADGEFVWMFEGKKVSEDNVKHLMSEKGDLSQEEAQAAVEAVKDQLRKNGKSTCELKEEKDSFAFTIAK